MPRGSFAKLTHADATAIAVYLESLPAVKHKVPRSLRPQPARDDLHDEDRSAGIVSGRQLIE